MRRLVRQFVQFGVVGGSGIIVNMAIALAMNKAHGGAKYSETIMFPIPGTDWNFRFSSLVWIVAFVLANVYNYQLNRMWTFKGTRRSWWTGLWQFMAIGAVAAFVGLILKAMMLNPTSWLYLYGHWYDQLQVMVGARVYLREYLSHFLSILITVPINFIVNKLWTFRGHGHPVPATTEATEAGEPDDYAEPHTPESQPICLPITSEPELRIAARRAE